LVLRGGSRLQWHTFSGRVYRDVDTWVFEAALVEGRGKRGVAHEDWPLVASGGVPMTVT